MDAQQLDTQQTNNNQINHQQINKQQLSSCPVAWQAKLTPNAIAIRTDNEQLTFLELHHRVNNLSLQLLKLTMKKGDRLVSIANNGLPLVLLQCTCLRNGFIFCPINPKFSDREIEQRLTLLNSTFVWQAGNPNSITLDFDDIGYVDDIERQIAVNNTVITVDPLAICNIIFTSGSSGTPKAVMHHFSNHYYSALGSQSVTSLITGDINLLSLPMFHISGYATVMRTLLAGATLQISEKKIAVERLRQWKITHLSLVSSQLQQLLSDSQFQSTDLAIKHLLLGGSSFPSKMLQETGERGFTYHLSYGSTEMSSQIATSTNGEALQLLPYRQLKIHDKEIMLTGETRFAGYFTGDSKSGLIDANSYFPSADIGEKEGQIVKIIGRKDRQFISGGENIQPEEVEKALLSSPIITQAYVLPIDDRQYGQRPIAFIKWNGEQQLLQLKTFIKDKLVAFKQPLHYFLLPEQQGLKLNAKNLREIATKLLNDEQIPPHYE